jgi:hypothetical protein
VGFEDWPIGLGIVVKLSAALLISAGLLLATQACFAEDQDPLASDAQKELAALTENGRAAFRKALIDCSLYVDDPSNANHEEACKVAAKAFTVEFKSGYSPISLLFNMVIASTRVYEANRDVLIQQGRGSEPIQLSNPAKDTIATLQMAYRQSSSRSDGVVEHMKDLCLRLVKVVRRWLNAD